MNGLFCDWKRNKNNIKGRLITVSFRLANIGTKNRLVFFLLLPYLVLYRIFIEWFLGTEIPYRTRIGKGLIIYHGQSTVINDGSIIGENCTLRHCVTIGNRQLPDNTYSACPVIGDYVDIGANASIIGPITIGNNVKIGAGTVVVKNVPNNSVVVGNPGRIISV